MAAVVPIDVTGDARVSHETANIRGRTYHYLLGTPNTEHRTTVFLIHGWPDLSMGWRYQINSLLDLGLRVVVPDMMGYGGTDAPEVPPESLALYGMKRAADDINELAHQLGASKIILGGHDWGGAIVYRVCLHHPELVSHLITIATPYIPPMKDYVPLEIVVKGLPNFGYQLQLRGPDVEAKIATKEQIRQFLNAIYGGKGPKGEFGFSVAEGVLFQNLPILGPTPLLSAKELDYYVDEYARHGLHGTLNWYRTSKQNFDDERDLTRFTIDIPVLFISATKDMALLESMSLGMEKYIPNLTRKVVETGHWALWQAPGLINSYIKDWLDATYFAAEPKI
ncbi:MAG: hypothetical protein M1839_007030 [Geoglossum umbratile]|nr:MAG: hypothetical protein M1839_007030 [Geoglossum umbratile]